MEDKYKEIRDKLILANNIRNILDKYRIGKGSSFMLCYREPTVSSTTKCIENKVCEIPINNDISDIIAKSLGVEMERLEKEAKELMVGKKRNE